MTSATAVSSLAEMFKAFGPYMNGDAGDFTALDAAIEKTFVPDVSFQVVGQPEYKIAVKGETIQEVKDYITNAAPIFMDIHSSTPEFLAPSGIQAPRLHLPASSFPTPPCSERPLTVPNSILK